MYKGYNLELEIIYDDLEYYHNSGINLYNDYKRITNSKLYELIIRDGKIDGSKMQENWFPQIDADIFISHSHKDKILALILAGFLYDNFGLISFIDSCLWGYANDLQRLVDDTFCLQRNGIYNYNKRNLSTSHIHMMLSTALNMMIDNTECLFFLNTPNSISTNSIINSTESPWLYSEITTSKIIRKRKIKRRSKTFSKGGLNGLNESIEYKLDLNHLTTLKNNDFNHWINESYKFRNHHSLDILYYLFP